MATVLFGRDGKTTYVLGKELKSGGEGVVYSIEGKSNYVAKVYKKERVASSEMRTETQDKILAMLDMNFESRFNGKVIVAWPEDALFDSSGFFLGFIMPRIEKMKSLIWATRPSDRVLLWPNGYRWHYSVAIAFNLALTVEHLHKSGIIVGDMNTNNILIDAKGNVTLIDSDSFNITTRTGQEYKCIVGFPEVLPPELQGKDLTKASSQFTEKTDDFSLAVHIFNLLCNNCHPFGCLNYSIAHGSSSNPQIIDNIIKGYCPYVGGSTEKTVDDALDMDVFPDEMRILFDHAFHYNAATAIKRETIANRPTATAWRTALGNLYNVGVSTCSVNQSHEYPKSYHNGCPWCAIEQRKSISSKKAPQTICISVIHCDKDGNLLRKETLDIEYGKRGTAYAITVSGYHVVGERSKVEVDVDSTGQASENPVRFIYDKNKKVSRKVLIAVASLLILAFIPIGKDNSSLYQMFYLSVLPTDTPKPSAAPKSITKPTANTIPKSTVKATTKSTVKATTKPTLRATSKISAKSTRTIKATVSPKPTFKQTTKPTVKSTFKPRATVVPILYEFENIEYDYKSGDHGSGVKRIQERLIELGYLNDTADGQFGPKTKAAVEAFQRNNGIHGNSKAYGVATTATQAVLFSDEALSTWNSSRLSGWTASADSFALQKGHYIEYKNGEAIFHFEIYNNSSQPIVAIIIRYCIVDSNNNLIKGNDWTTYQNWWYNINLSSHSKWSFKTEVESPSKAYRLFWTITEVVFANGEVYMGYEASNTKDYEYSGYSTYY